jgi:hypothetical protein
LAKFSTIMPVTETVTTELALATLGNATQIEMILTVSRYLRSENTG